MSRTVHHVPQQHWNRRERSFAVAHVLIDLRFAAGCRRVPQFLRHEVTGGGYLHGHGGSRAVGLIAREFEGAQRAESRMFATEAVKAHRAGADIDELCEPDGRTRHSAIWDSL